MNSPGAASGSGSSVHMPGKVNFLSILIFSMKCLKVKSEEAVGFVVEIYEIYLKRKFRAL